MEALTCSVIFVPILSHKSVHKWMNVPSDSEAAKSDYFNEAKVDNFLLECVIALELHSRLSKLKKSGDVVFACKRILPIFIDKGKPIMSENVATATVNKAEGILRSLNVLDQNGTIDRFSPACIAPAHLSCNGQQVLSVDGVGQAVRIPRFRIVQVSRHRVQ